jgi:hypothetical protein
VKEAHAPPPPATPKASLEIIQGSWSYQSEKHIIFPLPSGHDIFPLLRRCAMSTPHAPCSAYFCLLHFFLPLLTSFAFHSIVCFPAFFKIHFPRFVYPSPLFIYFPQMISADTPLCRKRVWGYFPTLMDISPPVRVFSNIGGYPPRWGGGGIFQHIDPWL